MTMVSYNETMVSILYYSEVMYTTNGTSRGPADKFCLYFFLCKLLFGHGKLRPLNLGTKTLTS